MSGEVAAPPGDGVTGDVIDIRIPDGALPIHEVLRVTVELKPLRGLIVIDAVPVPPCVIVMVGVEEVSEKSTNFDIVVLVLLVEFWVVVLVE